RLLDISGNKFPSTQIGIESILKSRTITVTQGRFKGKDIAIWEILNSENISAEKREELIRKYKSGTLSLEELITVLLKIIQETEITSSTDRPVITETKKLKTLTAQQDMAAELLIKADPTVQEEGIQKALESIHIEVKKGQYAARPMSLWDLIHSKYISETKRQELLGNYKLTVEDILQIVTQSVEEFEQKNIKSTIEAEGKPKAERSRSITTQEQEDLLKSELVEASRGILHGQKVSVWELLHSEFITESKKNEILQNYSSGVWNLEQIIRIITTTIENTASDETIRLTNGELHKALNVISVNLITHEFQKQRPSLWKVLHSKYLSEGKRKEQLSKHQVTVEKVKQTILQLIDDSELCNNQEIQNELELKFTEVSSGEFKGQNVSVWFLLYSKYITEEKRQELLQKYRSGTLTLEELLKTITTIIEETERIRSLKFKGFRRQVTATELLQSEIIDQNTLNELTEGRKTVEEVTKMDNVKRYLEGSGSIAGVFVTSKKDPSQKEKVTIYKAMLNGRLRPGTALILLEAQAATGFVIDPIENKKLSVDEALDAGLIGREIYDKLLSAERGVTGYKDPYTNEKISLFQAMKKELILKDHGIRLLEAQIATGGIIDPIHSHRVPVEVAYRRGYFDEEMNQILSDPNDDTKGFFDPNTHENLTYLQLLQRCVTDPDTGLSFLDISGNRFPSTQIGIESILKSRTITVTQGRFKGKDIAIWEILNSENISAEKREELIRKYKSGTLSLEELITVLLKIIQETEITSSTDRPVITETKKLKTLTAQQDLAAELLIKADPTVQEEGIQKALESIHIEVKKGQYAARPMSLWDLIHSKYISETKRQELLGNYKLTIEDILHIVTQSIEEFEQKNIKSTIEAEGKPKAERSRSITTQEQEDVLKSELVEASKGILHGQKVSVWELLHSEFITESKKNEILQNYSSGVWNLEQIIRIITTTIENTASDETIRLTNGELHKALNVLSVNLTTHEFQKQRPSLWKVLHSKYLSEGKRKEQLRKHQVTVEKMKQIILQLIDDSELRNDQEIQNELELKFTEVSSGEFKGQNVSVWFLLYSKYITEEKRQELLQKYRSGALTLEELLKAITTIIEETERIRSLKFKGFRRQVTATELLQSEIIDQNTLNELSEGSKTVEEVTKMDNVKRYLEGSGSIAGVFVTSKKDPSQKEKVTIYKAMLNGRLRPGTALILLEAQAATGFVIDPIENKKLSVDEALDAGLIGREIYDKLLSAERGVTGYKDPYTDEKISLFQAMKKELIVKDHGIRLLEAQIATGGIIDPIHSHRVPVEVAYKRGYFDEEMNQILSDPSDDTKGFFDPNTHENLTYLQLLQRCVTDPGTGLHLLDISEEQKVKSVLQSRSVQVDVGTFKGKETSVWDLLYSQYISVEKREELLKKYRASTLTIEELMTILITIITETHSQSVSSVESSIKQSFQSVTVKISTGNLQEESMSLWDLLHSKYIPEDKREELIEKYKSGTLTIQEIINIVLSMIHGSSKTEVIVKKEVRVTSAPIHFDHWPSEQQVQNALLVIPSVLSEKQSQRESVSAWDLLNSEQLPKDKKNELLQTFTASVREVISTCGSILKDPSIKASEFIAISGQQQKTFQSSTSLVSVGQTFTSSSSILGSEAAGTKRAQTQDFLKTVDLTLTVGQLKDHKSSVWELLHSSYVTPEKKNELIEGYENGRLSLAELMKCIMEIFMKAEEATLEVSSHHTVTVSSEKTDAEYPEAIQKSLQAFSLDNYGGEFAGRSTSLWHLLHSAAITQTIRRQLLTKYYTTVKTIVTTLINEVQRKAFSIKPDTETFLKSVQVQVSIGEFKLEGKTHSLWDLLHSKYLTEDKRRELIEKYESKSITWEEMFKNITAVIKETEEKSRNIKFSGLRRQVSASELLKSEIIDQDTLLQLAHGTKSLQEVTQMNTVKRYLEGTKCIAGVLVPSKADPTVKEKMSIYDAMLKRILRPGTALVLLEAQAATGFIVDPIKNIKLTVDEAVASRVFGKELHSKLLSAERAVTGYNDPTTNQKISLFQAMQKDLIVKDHGIRLLEAQIATGGIIDPVHSHRVPVDVAYKRGYFDEVMNQILSDPSDDTKGFFDPNTHENLTYLQLIQRAVQDADTGLLMLEVANK
ncbi:epiplakin-like, partial [Ranitomeya imitator]